MFMDLVNASWVYCVYIRLAFLRYLLLIGRAAAF